MTKVRVILALAGALLALPAAAQETKFAALGCRQVWDADTFFTISATSDQAAYEKFLLDKVIRGKDCVLIAEGTQADVQKIVPWSRRTYYCIRTPGEYECLYVKDYIIDGLPR